MSGTVARPRIGVSEVLLALEVLGLAAALRNIEEVSSEHMTLTSTCVQCHRLLHQSALAEHNGDPSESGGV